MNRSLRRRLIDKACAILDEGWTLLAVSLDDFFEGNTDERSIGVNLLNEQHIGLASFRRVLTEIRSRPEVQDVLLELSDIPDPDEELDADEWPTACVAFVVTSAPVAEVTQWVSQLRPRDICEGWCVDDGVKTPILDNEFRPGMRPVRVWLL